MLWPVEHEVAIVPPLGEQPGTEARALDALEPVAGNDLVGVDVAPLQGDSGTGDDVNWFHGTAPLCAQPSSSGVAKRPATAVAAATAGDTRCVRPPRP